VVDGADGANGSIFAIAPRVDQRAPLPQQVRTLLKPLL
jgi:hypothetical protein